ncbi:MAG: type II toxin-antitoxin system MqsA family antitoxin [Chloroflexi bacterium]|nr:type II toxin-antitoxin system MqsA family antitoxin [Chloroflexota bacterium]
MVWCYFCKGKLKSTQIRHVHPWKGRVYIFNRVPAEVCQQCGEVYLAPAVLEKMDRVTLGEVVPDSTESIPVYGFEKVAI